MFSSQNSQVSSDANYIEDVFSTYLYTGNGSTQTITNGIDLAGEGGMVWVKRRDGAVDHALWDTVRVSGANEFILVPNNTDASTTAFNWLTYNNDGFTISAGASGQRGGINDNGNTQVSWTFRKQPKFFDVVTYTGNGASTQVISHLLGSAAGCVIVKPTNTTGDWFVYHASIATGIGSSTGLKLNTTGYGEFQRIGNVTSTTFEVQSAINVSGDTYVAYLFAHNAGGFGLTGTDNVISCGSFTTDGDGMGTVNLGYEPQWVMIKSTNAADGWHMVDNMRGFAVANGLYNGLQDLQAQASSAESASSFAQPSATGFNLTYFAASRSYIYIAIRRGPMKVPTSGTSVFDAVYEGSTTPAVQTSFPVDFGIWTRKDLTSDKKISSRLQGAKKMYTNSTTEEQSNDANLKWDYQNGYKVNVGASGDVDINWVMRRAPSFFDEVCYTGTGVANRNITHNLTVVPELVIVKNRTSADYWYVRHANATGDLYLNSTSAQDADFYFLGTPTSTTFNVAYGDNSVNGSGKNYVAYLFSSCVGVSKVGGYTGTGTTQQINCGFASGARFVLIKCASSSGDWYVWDSARGIVSGNDPYLLLNSTAAEVTSTDYIDTYSAGFEISSTAPADINASGRTFVFLAIA